MKKIINLIIALSLCFAIAGCSEQKVEDSKFTKGTYTSSAKGRNGDVKVTVELSEEKIEDIKAEHQETPGIGDKAIEELINKTLEKQLIPADIVTGATITSNAFIDALTDAIESSGADVSLLVSSPDQKLSTDLTISEKEYDIIVVGGGAAGLMASVTGAEAGEDVLLLEKLPYLGGNMKISAGII